MLGNNMFAYCLNNPVNCYDPGGTATLWTSTGDVNPFSPGYFGIGGGGGGGISGCGGSGNSGYKDIIDELSDKTDKTLDAISAIAEDCWDAYMRGYNLQQETQMREAQMITDMFDSPEDIERSIDVIEATAGFSLAVYEVAYICIVATPTTGGVALAVAGVIWGARSVIRACQ